MHTSFKVIVETGVSHGTSFFSNSMVMIFCDEKQGQRVDRPFVDVANGKK